MRVFESVSPRLPVARLDLPKSLALAADEETLLLYMISLLKSTRKCPDASPELKHDSRKDIGPRLALASR